jgi:hypothetical protein
MANRKHKREFDPKKTWAHKGKKTKSTAAERLEYCRKLWIEDPHIPLNGSKGMNQRLLEKYGIAARAEQLMTLRSEIRTEQKDKAEAAKAAKIAKAKRPFNPVMPKNKTKAADSITSRTASTVHKVVPPIPPVPKPPNFPEPLLVPAVKAVELIPDVTSRDKPIPGSTKSSRDVQMRYDYARLYFQMHPEARNDEVITAVKTKFGGMGINGSSLADIKERLGVGQRHPRRRARHHNDKPSKVTKEKTMETTQEVRIERPKVAPLPEEAIRAAVQMLLDEVPNLRSLELTIDDEGRPSVEWEVATVRTGKIEL